MPEEVAPVVEPVVEPQAPVEPAAPAPEPTNIPVVIDESSDPAGEAPVEQAPVEEAAPVEPEAPAEDEAVEEPAAAPAPAKAKGGVTLSDEAVKALGISTNQAQLVEQGEVESTVKVGKQTFVVGNEEVS